MLMFKRKKNKNKKSDPAEQQDENLKQEETPEEPDAQETEASEELESQDAESPDASEVPQPQDAEMPEKPETDITETAEDAQEGDEALAEEGPGQGQAAEGTVMEEAGAEDADAPDVSGEHPQEMVLEVVIHERPEPEPEPEPELPEREPKPAREEPEPQEAEIPEAPEDAASRRGKEKEKEKEKKQKENKKAAKPAKKKKKKRKKSKNYLLRIFICLCILAACFAVMHLDYFTVSEVSVEGNEYLTDAEVLKGTNIKEGENIFDIHFFIEKTRIKKNLYVAQVRLKRELPNRIVVTVCERTGLAQFMMDKKYVITDNAGTVIEVSKEKRNITFVDGLEVTTAQKGQKAAFKDDKNYEKVMALLALTDDTDMFFKKVQVKDGRFTGTIFGKLKVTGAYNNVMDSLESGALKTVVYDLYQKGKKKGTIYVSGDNYCSFTE